MLDVLRAKAPLRADLDPERANDLLLLYAGMDVYHSLVEVQGWSHDEWVTWTRSTSPISCSGSMMLRLADRWQAWFDRSPDCVCGTAHIH